MTDLYYGPWDIEINLDPDPTYRRLATSRPVYYNERDDFWGLSRCADVDAALRHRQRLSSAKGDIVEVVKAVPVMPPGSSSTRIRPCTPSTAHRVARLHAPRRCARWKTRSGRSAWHAWTRWWGCRR